MVVILDEDGGQEGAAQRWWIPSPAWGDSGTCIQATPASTFLVECGRELDRSCIVIRASHFM